MAEANDTAQGAPIEEWPTGRLLGTAARMVEHAWTTALDERGLTHAGLIVLDFLQAGPQSQIDLARLARVETQTMSRTIERLERQGLLAREKDARDRRRHVVTLTPAGHQAWVQTRSLEGELFPEFANTEGLRDALIAIIRSSSQSRWRA
ncbi:MarR family winged helix-turn-helix transcriptional regulator [Galbitalea soli]|uniref:MarR family transcriptional regulator n=1 Tax=Galbitalea soli TaxID=1268042 RepID=A0A7C9TTA3_9MICO|nr:MarR family transcriptional regulator [Galbitalea soli]NEM91943.1 MarR family transcriptional regulator [Galbitalea soli]NYJ32109.1 DNA-binding MarR family transcriptional regulator [Galbitalea soli]